jgi:hypothetical protein
VLLTTLTWQPDASREALEVDLEALFRDAHDDPPG